MFFAASQLARPRPKWMRQAIDEGIIIHEGDSSREFEEKGWIERTATGEQKFIKRLFWFDLNSGSFWSYGHPKDVRRLIEIVEETKEINPRTILEMGTQVANFNAFLTRKEHFLGWVWSSSEQIRNKEVITIEKYLEMDNG